LQKPASHPRAWQHNHAVPETDLQGVNGQSPPKQRKRVVLRAIVNGGAKAAAMEKALAAHIAAHPEDAGGAVEDFNWILRIIIDPRPNSSSSAVAPS
jgi:hypothetical protein